MRHDATLNYSKSFHFYNNLSNTWPNLYETDLDKNTISVHDNNFIKLFKFYLPLAFNLKTNTHIDTKKIPDFFVVLIQAGQAAMASVQEGKMIHHKVIRKYMVRKKQGKAQLSYLKTKGKSRAGSRIRLANSVAFFEEINAYINRWYLLKKPDTIIYQCTPLLWGKLYQSKVKPLFDKKDPLLKKLPLDISRPDLRQVKKAVNYACNGYITFSPECPLPEKRTVINQILKYQ